MFKDSPDGQTHCYTPEEEMRMAFARDTQGNDYDYTHSGHPGHGYDDAPTQDAYVGYQAALASQAEQVRKLEEQRDDAVEQYLEDRRISREQLAQANETITALQARIEYDTAYIEGQNDSFADLMETKRELLAVIEQKHTALLDLKNQVNKFCEEQGEWDFYTGDAEKALALTPDLSALKEDRARVLEEAAETCITTLQKRQKDGTHIGFNAIMTCVEELRRMAAEMRKP